MTATISMVRKVGLGSTVDRIQMFLHARFAQRQRERQFRRLKLTSPVIREILGQRMLLDPAQQGLDRDLLLNGIREPVATGHLMRLLENDDVFLDIGANIGYYTLMASRLSRKVYAVEPHPENFRRLKENLGLNGSTNVETFNLAFGSSETPLHLRCSGRSNWHSCQGALAGDKNTIEVPGQQVDTFLTNREQPTFLKMDVEGYELEVLRGAVNTMRKVRGVFLEIHGDILNHCEIRETLDILGDNGLSPTLIVQHDWPGLSHLYPTSHLKEIYRGDRGTYEIFFERIR